jgi:hypothetical protein
MLELFVCGFERLFYYFFSVEELKRQEEVEKTPGKMLLPRKQKMKMAAASNKLRTTTVIGTARLTTGPTARPTMTSAPTTATMTMA